jgi:hypothetical protein
MIPPDPISGFHVDESAAVARRVVRLVADLRINDLITGPVFPRRPQYHS